MERPTDAAAHDGVPGRGRAIVRLPAIAWPLLLAVVAGACWLARWMTAPTHGTGDAFWYTRLAYLYGGTGPDDATARAAAFVQRLGIESAAGATALVRTMDPRYPAIFAGRPWFPATGAALIPVAGPDAMAWSVAVAGVLAGVVLGWFAARMTGSWTAGLLALLLLFVLPSGEFLAQVMADPWAMLFWIAGLAAASLYLANGARRWLLAAGVASLLLAVSKSANGGVLAATLVFTAGALLAGRRRTRSEDRRRAVVGASAVAGIVAAVVAVSTTLGLPGLETSVQDLLTSHFTQPDVASPYTRLLVVDLHASLTWAVAMVMAPWVPALGAVAAIGLLRRPAPWVIPWLVGPAACVLLLLAHPVSSEIPRMMGPAWASVALGLAAWIPDVRRRLRTPAGAMGDAAA